METGDLITPGAARLFSIGTVKLRQNHIYVNFTFKLFFEKKAPP
jgi:hypothetical protein